MLSEFMRKLMVSLRFVNAPLVMICTLVVLLLIYLAVKKLHRKKKETVQIAAIDRVNGEAERNIIMNRELGKGNLCSSLGRGIEDTAVLRFYRLDRKNRSLKRKIPAAYTKELCVGDIGILTYKGKKILSFEKTGSIQSEDQKRVRFQL